jgi:hypothetical protein
MKLNRTLGLLSAVALGVWLLSGPTATGTHLTNEQCQGQHVTILGANQGASEIEVINGTTGHDGILARGGPDLVVSDAGNDFV